MPFLHCGARTSSAHKGPSQTLGILASERDGSLAPSLLPDAPSPRVSGTTGPPSADY